MKGTASVCYLHFLLFSSFAGAVKLLAKNVAFSLLPRTRPNLEYLPKTRRVYAKPKVQYGVVVFYALLLLV